MARPLEKLEFLAAVLAGAGPTGRGQWRFPIRHPARQISFTAARRAYLFTAELLDHRQAILARSLLIGSVAPPLAAAVIVRHTGQRGQAERYGRAIDHLNCKSGVRLQQGRVKSMACEVQPE